MQSKVIILILLLVLASGMVYASDFSIISVSQLTSNPYRGDMVNLKGIIQADPNNLCKIQCQYNTGSATGSVSDSGGSETPSTLSSGETQEFPFSVRAEGLSGMVSTTLTVTCDRVVNYVNCWQGSASQQKSVSFSFLYAGDGKCTTSKEKCQSYNAYIGTADCSCSSTQECRPDGNRNPDSKGCQTYCGNGICEKSYESCSSCSKDCRKCDLASCSDGSECEGGYCVWGVCWHEATRKDDGHCDSGENCGNSPSDCACAGLTHCESSRCVTWCGNGNCEESERGICKADCTWCGDGTCQSSESCSSCADDCGACKKATKEEEYQRNEEAKKETSTSESQEDPSHSLSSYKTQILIGVGVLAVLTLVYGVFWFIKHSHIKKSKEENTKSEHQKEQHCPNCHKKLDKDSKFCHKCGHKIG